MRLSYKWLQEFVNLEGYTPESLADKLTTAGLEVEGIERMASGTKLCIGEVLECVDHPDSDHLHVTKTNVGDEVLQIVCGAPNCRAGLKVIVALPGCVLPGGEIKKGMIRGQESNGMLCALYELGVDKKNLTEYQASGIEELPADAPVGETNVLEYLGLDDVILEVGLTPNRADCSAMWNMAKEVGAVIRREVKLPEVEGASKVGKPNTFKVNSTTEKCPYFLGKVVNHVEVGPSPKWMQEYLHAAGVKAINNVVDISNYVMLETGQPLHFYDLAKLPHHEITVVDDVEMKMTALDGIEYQIEKGDLLITTGGEPTGVAGIMGGEESKIDENTKAIFIEAALFNHVSIRNTSRRLNLLTEAATRFSKGLEPLSQIKAVDRSVDLLTKYAGGSDYEENVEYGHNDYKPVVIEETLTHMNSLLGMNFTMDQVVEVLTALDFKPEVNGDTVISHIPSYRTDMERNADVDEEVIRLIGFDALKSTLPTMEATVGRLSPEQVARRDIRHMMTGLGLSEIVTYTLVSDKFDEDKVLPMGESVKLASPMSEDRKVIRQSLMPSVLECVQYNQARKQNDTNFFEISMVYAEGKKEERLAIVLGSDLQMSRLHNIVIRPNFYTLKGILIDWMSRMGFKENRIFVKPNTLDTVHFHPYVSAELYLGKELVGIFGEVHPTYAAQFNLKKVYYAEILGEVTLNNKASKVKFQPLNPYPSVSRDIALVVDQEVSASEILMTVNNAGKGLVTNLEIFDVYQGEHVEEGYKSVALNIVYQADHTMKEEEINEVHTKILNALESKLGAVLRK